NSQDAFVLKLGPESEVIYSTLLGGTATESGQGIAVNQRGVAYVVGNTNSTDFPTKTPFQAAYGGGSNDAFLARFSPQADLSLSLIGSRDPVMVNNNLTYILT